MGEPILKHCKKCGCETERNTAGRCKPCRNIRNAAWRAKNPPYRAANPEKQAEAVAAWRAANPEKVKASNAAWYEANKDKDRARRAARYKANPEKRKAASAAWRAANPESTRIIKHNRRAKTRENGGVLSKGLSAKLFKLQRGKCACCKQPLGDEYHLDHIMPIKLGGPNIDSNIQLLRQRCNNEKHAKHPVEFMQSRGFLL